MALVNASRYALTKKVKFKDKLLEEEKQPQLKSNLAHIADNYSQLTTCRAALQPTSQIPKSHEHFINVLVKNAGNSAENAHVEIEEAYKVAIEEKNINQEEFTAALVRSPTWLLHRIEKTSSLFDTNFIKPSTNEIRSLSLPISLSVQETFLNVVGEICRDSVKREKAFIDKTILTNTLDQHFSQSKLTEEDRKCMTEILNFLTEKSDDRFPEYPIKIEDIETTRKMVLKERKEYLIYHLEQKANEEWTSVVLPLQKKYPNNTSTHTSAQEPTDKVSPIRKKMSEYHNQVLSELPVSEQEVLERKIEELINDGKTYVDYPNEGKPVVNSLHKTGNEDKTNRVWLFEQRGTNIIFCVHNSRLDKKGLTQLEAGKKDTVVRISPIEDSHRRKREKDLSSERGPGGPGFKM